MCVCVCGWVGRGPLPGNAGSRPSRGPLPDSRPSRGFARNGDPIAPIGQRRGHLSLEERVAWRRVAVERWRRHIDDNAF